MIDLVVDKLILYIGCSLPSLLFYFFTRNTSAPVTLLLLLGVAQVVVPIAFNGRETVLDRVICAVMAVVMTSGMFCHIQDPSQPFYAILTQWNEKTKKNDDEARTIEQVKQDARMFLARAVVYMLVYMPVFATMDGFIRVCNEPPEVFHDTPYLQQFFSTGIPYKSTYYYIWVGMTLSLHIALIPLVHLLLNAIQLNILLSIPASKETLIKQHADLKHFVAQPPLFDKPWMTRSVYDLWSRRWHQVFRPGFYQVAYRPIRQLFDHQAVGRAAGTMAAFACSGLMHDYIILVTLGYSNYNKPGVLGYQTLFFLLQAVATLVSVQSSTLPGWMARVLTYVWVLYTAPLFVEPYLRIGLHLYAEVPGFPKFMDSRMAVFCPYGMKI